MRHADWTDRLWKTVGEFQNVPFEWGKVDCCLFAARCVDEITGSVWVPHLMLRYWDEESAREFLDAQGGLEAAVTARLGPSVPRLQARRGDVCMVETPYGYGLAICLGATVVIPGKSGLVSKPLAEVIKAWRVD